MSQLQDKVTGYYNDVATRYYEEHFKNPDQYPALLFRQMHILQLLESANVSKDANVLDAGCGTGDLLKEMYKLGYTRLSGIDISDSMIAIAKEQCADAMAESKLHLQTGSVLQLPFGDSSCDVVICSGLVEYLSDDEGWVAEVKRVLKPGGILVLNVTNSQAIRRWTLGPVTRLKQLSLFRKLAAFMKTKVLHQGTLNHFPFSIRTHAPAQFDQYLASKSFKKLGHRYFDFCVLPYPLDTVFNKALLAKRKAKEQTAAEDHHLDGCGYIVMAQKQN
jgi:ubiquinone/menaquinone biosynthesis C-methylase UbiE